MVHVHGFFIRHARGVEFDNVEVSYLTEESRPAFVLDDVKAVDFFHVNAQRAGDNAPTFVLKNVSDFSITASRTVPDTRLERAEQKKL